MKLLLAYMFLVVIWGVRSAHKERLPRVWVLLLIAGGVGVAYLSRRVI